MATAEQPCSDFEKKAISRRFGAYDRDSSGFIDTEEFGDFCEDMGIHDAAVRQYAFESCDFDGSGRISLDEFLRWWSSGGGNVDTIAKVTPSPALSTSPATPKLSVISPCVFLYVTQVVDVSAPSSNSNTSQTVSFKFDVECAKMRSIDLRVHFGESTNLVLSSRHKDATVSGGELKLFDIPPFARVTVMTLSTESKMSLWQLKYETRVREKAPPTDNNR